MSYPHPHSIPIPLHHPTLNQALEFTNAIPLHKPPPPLGLPSNHPLPFLLPMRKQLQQYNQPTNHALNPHPSKQCWNSPKPPHSHSQLHLPLQQPSRPPHPLPHPHQNPIPTKPAPLLPTSTNSHPPNMKFFPRPGPPQRQPMDHSYPQKTSPPETTQITTPPGTTPQSVPYPKNFLPILIPMTQQQGNISVMITVTTEQPPITPALSTPQTNQSNLKTKNQPTTPTSKPVPATQPPTNTKESNPKITPHHPHHAEDDSKRHTSTPPKKIVTPATPTSQHLVTRLGVPLTLQMPPPPPQFRDIKDSTPGQKGPRTPSTEATHHQTTPRTERSLQTTKSPPNPLPQKQTRIRPTNFPTPLIKTQNLFFQGAPKEPYPHQKPLVQHPLTPLLRPQKPPVPLLDPLEELHHQTPRRALQDRRRHLQYHRFSNNSYVQMNLPRARPWHQPQHHVNRDPFELSTFQYTPRSKSSIFPPLPTSRPIISKQHNPPATEPSSNIFGTRLKTPPRKTTYADAATPKPPSPAISKSRRIKNIFTILTAIAMMGPTQISGTQYQYSDCLYDIKNIYTTVQPTNRYRHDGALINKRHSPNPTKFQPQPTPRLPRLAIGRMPQREPLIGPIRIAQLPATQKHRTTKVNTTLPDRATRTKRQINTSKQNNPSRSVSLTESISVTYKDIFYITNAEKHLVLPLRFTEILNGIIALFNYTTELADVAKVDLKDFILLNFTANNTPDSTRKSHYRVYSHYDLFSKQKQLCKILGLTTANPIDVINYLLDNRAYFSKIELFVSNEHISCKFDETLFMGKTCLTKLVKIANDNGLEMMYSNEDKLTDYLTGKKSDSYVVLISKSRLYVSPSISRNGAIICAGSISKELSKKYKSETYFNSMYFSTLSSIYINLIDSLHMQYLSLEELYFQTIPVNAVIIGHETDKLKVAEQIINFLPENIVEFPGTTTIQLPETISTLIDNNILRDDDLMTVFRTIKNKPRTFWLNHSMLQLNKILFTVKNLHLSTSTMIHFYSNTKNSNSKTQHNHPLQFLTPRNCKAASLATSIKHLTRADISNREIFLMTVLLRNNLVEALHHMNNYIQLQISIPPNYSITAMLHASTDPPNKRSSQLDKTTTTEPNIQTDTTTQQTVQTLPDQSPSNTIMGSYTTKDHTQNQHILSRKKRNVFASIFSLPTFEDLHMISKDEMELYKEQKKIISHMSYLHNTSVNINKNMMNFKTSLGQFENTEKQMNSKLATLLNTEAEVTKSISSISAALEASVKTSIDFIQLNTGITASIREINTLTAAIQSIIDQNLPIAQLSTTKIYDLVPKHTQVSIAFATITPHLTDIGHTLLIHLPVVSEYFIAYSINTIPFFLPNNTANNKIIYQYIFPHKHFAISPSQNYFEFTSTPCLHRKTLNLCKPTDLIIHNNKHQCYSRLVKPNRKFKDCLGQLKINTKRNPPQQYLYSPDRSSVLIFSAQPSIATVFCQHYPITKKTKQIHLLIGLGKYTLPQGCTIQTDQLFIMSMSIIPSSLQDITITYPDNTFTEQVLQYHMELDSHLTNNISSLIATIQHFKLEIDNTPLHNLSNSISKNLQLHEIAKFQPFSLTLHNPQSITFWMQIIGITIAITIAVTCTLCCCVFCPSMIEATKTIFKLISTLICMPILCLQICKNLRPRRQHQQPQPEEELHCITPQHTSPAVSRQTNQLEFMPPSYADLRSQALTAQTDLAIQQKQVDPNTKITWTIQKFTNRHRIASIVNADYIFFNTKQNCIVDILDIPHPDKSIQSLPHPNPELLQQFHVTVGTTPTPTTTTIGDIIYFNKNICFDNISKTWRQTHTHFQVDGIRDP